MTQPSDSNERPLIDQTILLTRPAGQSEATTHSFESLGADVLVHPVIQILAPDDFTELDNCIKRLEEFDWLVLVSPNAVRFFCERFKSKTGSFLPLREMKVAAIGSTTLQALQTATEAPNWNADLVPAVSNSESLGHELASLAKEQRLLIPRVDRHSDTLTNILTDAKIEFEQPTTYQHAQVDSVDPKVLDRLDNGEIDWVTITSPAIATAAIELFGNSLLKSRVASISPRATRALRSSAHSTIIEAKTPNMEGLIAAIVEFENSNKH